MDEDVTGVGIQVDLLDEQADELALLLLSPCLEDLVEGFPAMLHTTPRSIRVSWLWASIRPLHSSRAERPFFLSRGCGDEAGAAGS